MNELIKLLHVLGKMLPRKPTVCIGGNKDEGDMG